MTKTIRKDPGTKLGIALAKFTITMVFTFLLAFPAMLLWNECLVPAMPDILSEVTWFQEFGIMMLINLVVTSKVTA